MSYTHEVIYQSQKTAIVTAVLKRLRCCCSYWSSD